MTTKEERIAALQMLRTLQDPQVDAQSKQLPVNKLKHLHPLSNDDDVECYLTTFERQCKHHGIPDAQRTYVLEPLLKGKAQKAFHLLTEGQKADCKVVKGAVLAAYKLTPDTYRQKFRTSSKLTSETFTQYANRLHLYLRRWMNPPDGLLCNPEFVVIMDRLIADQLISSLNDDSLAQVARTKVGHHR